MHAYRYPEVWVNLPQMDVRLLTKRMSGIDDGDDTTLATKLNQFFPWEINTGVGGNRIDNCNYLALFATAIYQTSRAKWTK